MCSDSHSVERLACIDLPALPLQLLLQKHPSWRGTPAAVVDHNRPQGKILWVNKPGQQFRVLPGMTFAEARDLSPHLHADVVESDWVERSCGNLFTFLCRFSPRVEPDPQHSGVFWVDPQGLSSLYGSLEQWAQVLHHELSLKDFQASIVVGFSRYRSFALARMGQGIRVLHSPREERKLASRVPLERVSLSSELRDGLAILGIRTLGQFLRLPPEELPSRFGFEAHALHLQASNRKWAPLQPRPLVDPVATILQFDPPDDDRTRTLFALKGALHRLMGKLAQRGQAMSMVRIRLELDHAAPQEQDLQPATPTLDVPTVIDLLRLRLESLVLPAGIEQVHIQLEGVRADSKQLALFKTKSRRDLEEASRALARIKAVFGARSVTQARLHEAHLPEAQFSWKEISQVRFPTPQRISSPLKSPLVRKVYPRPLCLPPKPGYATQGWLHPHGGVNQMWGPYRISGGWWARTIERNYYYAKTSTQNILWIYHDFPRKQWFLHGVVE